MIKQINLLFILSLFSILSIVSCENDVKISTSNDDNTNLLQEKQLASKDYNMNIKSLVASNPCAGYNDDCDEDWEDGYVEVPTKRYPDCIFNVWFKHRLCNGELELVINKWGPKGECESFWSDFHDLQDEIDLTNIEAYEGTRWFHQRELEVLVSAATTFTDLIPTCESGSTQSVSFSAAMCVKYCIVSFLGQEGGWEVYSFPCGDTCCKTGFQMCIGSDGVTVSQVTYSSEAEPGECSSNDIGQNQTNVFGRLECPRGTNFSYPCYSECYRLNYFY